MSNHHTRIEREAKEYKRKARSNTYCSNEQIEYATSGYLNGKQEEFNRAAPVVKALEEVYNSLFDWMTEKAQGEIKQILETYNKKE